MLTWNPQANELFLKARELRSPTDRQAYLDQACVGDAALRAEVDGLLEAGDQAGSFLEVPAPACAATVEHVPTERPGTIIGPYKLLEQIGEGGMGLVFVAEQQRPVKRRVALKIIKPGMDSRQVVARFEAERQALALMDHPNIAKIHDGGTIPGEPGCVSAGRPYFVMELVKGTPITEYCDQHRLTTRQRLALFVDVCHAVQHAHQKGIIHRDLKPSNVMVAVHDVTPVVKVIDFGIAKATGGRLTDKTVYTEYAQMVGTPLYMSPEQAGLSSLDVDTRSDVYSLGMLLFELLTGATPFENEHFRKVGYDEMRRIIREEEPPRPSHRVSTLKAEACSTVSERRGVDGRRLNQLLRGELDWIVMKALEKDSTRRYESASTFATDVQRYLNDEPVEACPQSASYRFRKFALRNKAALTTALMVVVALLMGTAVSVWQAVEADSARRLAENRLEKEKQARRDADASLQKAVEAVKRMLWQVARQKLGASPEMAETRQRLLEDAIAFYTDLIAFSPRNSQAYFERGLTYCELGKTESSREDWEKAIECDPENAEACARLAWQLGGKPGISLAKRAIEIQPTRSDYCRILGDAYGGDGRPTEAAASYKKAAEVHGPGSSRAYFYLALAERTVGNHRGELSLLEKSVSLDSPDWEAVEYLAHAYAGLGDYENALAAYAKAIDFPGMPGWDISWCLEGRGDVHLRHKNYEAALNDFNRAIGIKPNDSRYYKRRALAQFHLGHFAQALADIAKGVEINPGDTSNLWWIPVDLVASCPDESFRSGMLALADRTVELTKGAPGAYGARAMHYAARGLFDKAYADIEKLNDGPKSAATAEALAYLCLNLLKQVKYAESEPLLRECLTIRAELIPDDWRRFNVMNMLGGSLLGQKKYTEAEPLLLQGYEGMKQREAKVPADGKIRLPEAVERIVRLYEATEQPEKARAWREKLKPMP